MKNLILLYVLICSSLVFAHGTDDPYFVGATMLSNSFPTKEMELNKFQLKVSPFKFNVDVSQKDADDPGYVNGYGVFASGVYTARENDYGRFGFGGTLGYFRGTGQTVLLNAGSPLERMMGHHEIEGFLSAVTANMDLTKNIAWWNLPMFVGLSFQSFSTHANGQFDVANKNGVGAGPFGSAVVNQRAKLNSFGFFTGVGSQFVLSPDWFSVMPFTMISIPFSRPEVVNELNDERFRPRVPTTSRQSFIPAMGAEFAIPKYNLSLIYVPKYLSQGVSIYTLTFTRDF